LVPPLDEPEERLDEPEERLDEPEERLDEPEERLDEPEERLLDDVDRVERDRDVPDLDRLPLARLEDPLLVVRRLPDLAVEPVRFFVPEERLRLELLERPVRPPFCERPALEGPASPPLSSWSSWSSLSPINFLATPTAAGTATPSAAPATTFLPVDMPSFSFSSISLSFSAISTFLS
jgi:hypothetical protein